MKEIELKIPNLGDAESTEVIEISVKKGDEISKNDPVIVLESEKAAMEIPSDYEGIVKEIKVSEGESVEEGNIFAILEVADSTEQNLIPEVAKDEKNSLKTETKEFQEQPTKKTVYESIGINAGPAVRKVARELDINLSNIIGTGKNGMVTKDDLKKYIHSNLGKTKEVYASLEDLKDFGDYDLENQTKIKIIGAKNLTESWVSIPHVSHFEEADITNIEIKRKEINIESKIKITPLAFMVNAICNSLKEFPMMNSSLVGEGKLMIRKYINIGIAVSTSQGLLVPVIKNADKLNISEIAERINDLSEKARNKKLLNKDLSGATFTVSSLGNIGGAGFTPIINPPEVGIIGISRAKEQLCMEEGDLISKKILPFSLSYDHRVINGVDAGSFMNFLKKEIEKN